MTKILLLLACLTSIPALAQTAPGKGPCASPQVQLWVGATRLNPARAAFVPRFRLVMAQAPAACPQKHTYRVKEADITLVRNRRLVAATQRVSGAEVDLSNLVKLYQPGDRVFVEIISFEDTDARGTATLVDGRVTQISLNWLPIPGR